MELTDHVSLREDCILMNVFSIFIRTYIIDDIRSVKLDNKCVSYFFPLYATTPYEAL